jgi:hypothetical protein
MKLALLVTVHVHALVVVTAVLPVPPEAATFCEVGDKVKPQVPACDTVKVWPAIVSVPVRAVVEVFAAMLKLTLPLPDPLVPDVKVIQLALLVALHPHPAPAVMFVLPVPPAAATL